ncbi:MAG: YdcF family protein [Wenzhouxiangella sp.]
MLQAFGYPLGAGLVLGWFGVTLLLMGRRKAGGSALLIALGWLWVWSMPVFSDWLRGSLENRYPMLSAEQAPPAGAIVVLGGAFSHHQDWPYPNMSSNADRYWHGARLYHAGRAPLVILSGGRMPGRGAGLSDAGAGALFLADLGVPAEAILLEERALTTRGNALETAALLQAHGIEDFLLVTSALHMRRSEAAFRAVGLDPIPVATDFQVRRPIRRDLRRWLPDASALASASRAAHEYVGYWIYRLRGWA